MGAQILSNGEALLYAGYRLDEVIFWAFPLVAFAICAIHAARRSFRHPTPTPGESDTGLAGETIRVGLDAREDSAVRRVILRYTVPQRLFHWLNAGTCLVLLVSGMAIYSPGLLPGAISTATWFSWHRWCAVVLVLGMAFHLVYDVYVLDAMGFMGFDREARRTLMQIVRNFMGLSSAYPRYAKYNPLQLGAHWMIACTLFALAVTGLILWKPTRILLPLDLLGLTWDFVFFCRMLHDLFAATFMALVMGHVYFAVVIRKNWVISKTMVTGKVDWDHYLRFHRVTGELLRVEAPDGEGAGG